MGVLSSVDRGGVILEFMTTHEIIFIAITVILVAIMVRAAVKNL